MASVREGLAAIPAPGSGNACHSVLLPDNPVACALAREQTRKALHDHASPQQVDDAVLVVSELVANALQHSPGPERLDIDIYDEAALLWIFDRGRDPEAVCPTTPGDTRRPLEHGRGLYLTDVLASSWLVKPAPPVGKAVVALFPLSPTARDKDKHS